LKQKRDVQVGNCWCCRHKGTNPSTKSSKNELQHSNTNYKLQNRHKEAWSTGQAIKSESKDGRGKSSRKFTKE